MRSTQALRTSVVRYAAAFFIIFVSLLVRFAFQRWLGVSVPYLHFFPAVMIAAWFGGFGPGVVATLLAATTAVYFSLKPQSFITLSRADTITIPAFIAIGVVISWLFESARRSEAAYRDAAFTAGQRARELEAIFEAMPDGVYVGTSERITRVNAAGTARPRGSIAGRPERRESRARGAVRAFGPQRLANRLKASACRSRARCEARLSSKKSSCVAPTPVKMSSSGPRLRRSSTTIAWSEPSR